MPGIISWHYPRFGITAFSISMDDVDEKLQEWLKLSQTDGVSQAYLNKLGEEIGEKACTRHIRQQFPDAQLIEHIKRGSHGFDLVYKLKDGTLIVVESKFNTSQLGYTGKKIFLGSETGETEVAFASDQVRQGEPEWADQKVQELSYRPETDEEFAERNKRERLKNGPKAKKLKPKKIKTAIGRVFNRAFRTEKVKVFILRVVPRNGQLTVDSTEVTEEVNDYFRKKQRGVVDPKGTAPKARKGRVDAALKNELAKYEKAQKAERDAREALEKKKADLAKKQKYAQDAQAKASQKKSPLTEKQRRSLEGKIERANKARAEVDRAKVKLDEATVKTQQAKASYEEYSKRAATDSKTGGTLTSPESQAVKTQPAITESNSIKASPPVTPEAGPAKMQGAATAAGPIKTEAIPADQKLVQAKLTDEPLTGVKSLEPPVKAQVPNVMPHQAGNVVTTGARKAAKIHKVLLMGGRALKTIGSFAFKLFIPTTLLEIALEIALFIFDWYYGEDERRAREEAEEWKHILEFLFNAPLKVYYKDKLGYGQNYQTGYGDQIRTLTQKRIAGEGNVRENFLYWLEDWNHPDSRGFVYANVICELEKVAFFQHAIKPKYNPPVRYLISKNIEVQFKKAFYQKELKKIKDEFSYNLSQKERERLSFGEEKKNVTEESPPFRYTKYGVKYVIPIPILTPFDFIIFKCENLLAEVIAFLGMYDPNIPREMEFYSVTEYGGLKQIHFWMDRNSFGQPINGVEAELCLRAIVDAIFRLKNHIVFDEDDFVKDGYYTKGHNKRRIILEAFLRKPGAPQNLPIKGLVFQQIGYKLENTLLKYPAAKNSEATEGEDVDCLSPQELRRLAEEIHRDLEKAHRHCIEKDKRINVQYEYRGIPASS